MKIYVLIILCVWCVICIASLMQSAKEKKFDMAPIQFTVLFATILAIIFQSINL